MYEPQIMANTAANSRRREQRASFAPIGTITNLKTVHSVVISRQFAPGQDAIHHAGLRAVERGRKEPVRIVEREKDPARDQRIEEVVCEEERGEPGRRLRRHVRE